ncbi:hypothetical protein [Halapricum desulfuricans]|uniref:Uncharacterized protein n=1 Tax=Halapricum desulfuricans TaxID=2841257 RepID=A0A897N730_9EURY|nr:hypothetical protein [Halapricum desulfuricans]QSG08364.1 hypothetical protein HSR122_0961 [Halapricum desulfuricans]
MAAERQNHSGDTARTWPSMGYTDAVLSTAARVAAFVLAFASGAFGTTVLGVFLVGFAWVVTSGSRS